MEEKQKKRNRRERNRFFIRIIIYGIVITAALFCLKFKVVHNNNMYPTMRDGELAIFTQFKKYGLDSIILYEYEGETHIGRIKAQPSDEVSIDNKALFVNGNRIYEAIPYDTPSGSQKYPMKISDDAVFVLTDFRESSEDSREYGEIKKDQILGTLIFEMRYRGF